MGRSILSTRYESVTDGRGGGRHAVLQAGGSTYGEGLWWARFAERRNSTPSPSPITTRAGAAAGWRRTRSS